jgi:hypothetical protein
MYIFSKKLEDPCTALFENPRWFVGKGDGVKSLGGSMI